MDQQNLSAPESAQINTAEPLHGAAAPAVRDQQRAANPGNAHDLRNLLEAVADALTLPADLGATEYKTQLAERAEWALTVIRGALDEDPADLGWNADYLRSRTTAPKPTAEPHTVRLPAGERQ